ncbi:MAG TPA: ABC transporter permease [Thermoanaerobaculia bacterium]|nr:ABC transporter permease [Thermoanaerobaculia bacterium]
MSSPRRSYPLFELIRARLLEIAREPEAIFWVFFFPIGMALALGFAFRDKAPEPVSVGITGRAQTSVLREALTRSALLKPQVFSSIEEGRAALRVGKIALLVENGSPIVYWYDPTRPDSRLAKFEVDQALQGAAGRKDPVAVRDELVREKGSRYIDFLLPGLLGLNLLSTSVWGISYSIVNARLKKTLKLMTATPMRRSDYLLAQMLSRFALLALEAAVIVVFGLLVFQVPLRGSFSAFVLLCAVCGLSFTGLGLLCGSRVQTIEGVNGLINLILVPMWLFSGVFFSPDRFPKALHGPIQALPLTAANDALRAVMLEGRGLSTLAPQIAVLAVWGIISYAIALKIFRWQ